MEPQSKTLLPLPLDCYHICLNRGPRLNLCTKILDPDSIKFTWSFCLMPSIVSNVKKMGSHHGSSMAISLGLHVSDSVRKESIVHHSWICFVPTPISLAAASLLVISAYSTAFNMKETSYNFLLDIVLLAGISHVAIVVPRLSWNTKVLMDSPYSLNPACIHIRLLF